MSLFYSFNHIAIFLLFSYLGLFSGLNFNFCQKTTHFINIKINRALKRGEKWQKELNHKQILKKHHKNDSSHQNGAKNNKKTLKSNSTSAKLFKCLNFINNLTTKSTSCFCLILCVVLTFYFNFKLNFGEIRFVYVLVWVCFFFVGKSLCNLLANYFLCFYNYFIKKEKIKWENKTTTQEKQN